MPAQSAASMTGKPDELKEFVYLVSHDLAAPLRAVVEFSKLLKSKQDGQMDEESQMYLSFIHDGGTRMQAMLAALMEYSRLNTVPVATASIDCYSLVMKSLQALDAKIKTTGAIIECKPLPTIRGDEARLQKLFMALLDNALTYRAEDRNPHICVAAKEQSGKYVFTIADNGIGIEPRFYERVFQPFRRLHTDETYPGIGMGLACAKKIIEDAGETIWLLPGDGQGVKICFSWPA